MNLQEILLKKAMDGELGHFYILETSASSEDAPSALLSFAHTFIKNYYQKVEGAKQSMAHLMDHPDVFVLGSTESNEEEKKDKFFKVEEAESLARFFEYKPVQGKRKFAVITEGHRINTTVANKWLKLLEEPQGISTIFLLNPQKGQLLPTIHSRAIHLRIPAPRGDEDFSTWKDFLKEVQNMGLAQFLESYGKQDFRFWTNELIRWEAEQSDQFTAKQNFAKWIKSTQELDLFYQPAATKWSLFYAYLKENVLARLNQGNH
jgi:hypothetical protein